APESLTLIRLNYWGFDNAVHRGEIIIRSDLAGRLASIFGAALADRFPIRQMWRVDYFGGDDPTAMAADNTSGFNCRQVTGGTGLSPHSYGIAVDVNTVENPYYAQHWWPTTEYVDRSNVRVGMLFSGSAMTVAFQNNGFQWGASYLDYQHYEYVG
nr:M15 family metallopeptidase [Actinomycetota bacterium]